MSEFSQLSEQAPDHLGDNDTGFTVFFVDGFNTKKVGVIHPEHGIQNPYDFDLTPFIPNAPLRLEGLIDLIGDVIADAEARADVVEDERINFVQEYQPERFAELGDEVITCKILRREPAKLSRTGQSRPNRSFNFAYEYQNADAPNKVLCIESRPIDHKIELCVWGKTSTIANRRALWLERLLIAQRWAFTSKGVKPFYWMERGPDTVWTSNGVRLHQRPLQYFARLQEYAVLAFPTLREFEFELSTPNEL